MIIYYTHHYGNNKGESHRLLEESIRKFLLSEGSTADAARLAASVQTCGQFGKPYIPGFVPFSISHSGSTWAVLIDSGAYELTDSGSALGVGLDIQYPRRVDAKAVAERFFAAEDAEVIAEAADAQAADIEFFRLWTRREAMVKALGTSVAGTDVPPVSGGSAEYDSEIYTICDVDIPGDNLYAAVCYAGDLRPLRIMEL